VFLPGWGETGANGSLSQGIPIAGNIIVNPSQGDNAAVMGNGLPLRVGSRVRIVGAIVLDCGHGVTSPCYETENDPTNSDTKNLEVHPVYSVDVLQDFTTPRPQNIDLTGSWAASDVGTYYVNQSGNTIWWLGLSRDQGLTFANVFHGVITTGPPPTTGGALGNARPRRVITPPPPGGVPVIAGQWASVPLGSQQNNGNLTLYGTFCPNLADLTVPCDSSQPLSSWNLLSAQGSSNSVFSNPPNRLFEWQKLYDRSADPAPRILVPTRLVLGQVANGAEAAITFQISNAGSAPLLLSSITASALTMQVSPKTLTIPAGTSASITVHWLALTKQRGIQTLSGSVKLVSNDLTAPTVAVPMQLTVRGGPLQ